MGILPMSGSGILPMSSSGILPMSGSGFQPMSGLGILPMSNLGILPMSGLGFQPMSVWPSCQIAARVPPTGTDEPTLGLRPTIEPQTSRKLLSPGLPTADGTPDHTSSVNKREGHLKWPVSTKKSMSKTP